MGIYGIIITYNFQKGISVQFDPQKTIFLIDGSSFLYRAYYGLRPLHTPQGEPVQAVYAFCRMIKKLISTFNPSYISLVWDSKGKTTRHEMFPEYKATRQAPPSDLFAQKEYVMEFATLIGLCQAQQQGIEADDIMYSLAQENKKEGNTIVFITADKDMGQAIDAQTVMFDPFKEQFIDAKAFHEKMTFDVEKLPFYFALLGDSSDNIPGVHGIGKKGALDLVHQFSSLEDLYAHLDKVTKSRTRQILEEQKDNAFLSKKLFLLQYHPTGLTKQNLAFDKKNWKNAQSLFVKLNFTTLLKDLIQALYVQTPGEHSIKKLDQYTFETIVTIEQLHQLAELIKTKRACSLDTETDGLKALQANLVGISFCVEEGKAYYIPFGHKTNESQLDWTEVCLVFKPILEDSTISKYLHNAKFDQLVLHSHGIELKGIAFDTMVAASLVIKDWQRAGLKDLSLHYFNEPMLTYDEVVKVNKYKDFSHVPLALATDYGAADAHQTFKLKAVVENELKNEKLFSLYNELEEPLIQILYAMEVEGILLDINALSALNEKVVAELVRIEKDILSMVPEKHQNINLNSPKQIEQLLFTDLGLPPQKKSAKGTGYSTDQEVLEALSRLHIVPGLILKYREFSKLKTTYIDALPAYVNPKDGRVHTTFNQIATATGRLASSEPNLQNVPTNSGYGTAIREAFKAEPGHLFLSADYSQIELRVLAHLSKDSALINAFLQGHDIHAETAARIFNVPLNQVSSEQRQLGKRINFSILYGLTPYGLSKDLRIPFKESKIYIERYFQQYPGVQAWMDQIIIDTKQHGYVTTHWGRRRYISGIYERNKSLYEEACRVAINTVAQGTAAEIVKIGMLNLSESLEKAGLKAKMILQIHDELLLSVPLEQKNETESLVKNILEGVVSWDIPMQVNIRCGNNWKDVSK